MEFAVTDPDPGGYCFSGGVDECVPGYRDLRPVFQPDDTSAGIDKVLGIIYVNISERRGDG